MYLGHSCGKRQTLLPKLGAIVERILLTGGNGFIAREIYLNLKKQ